MKSIKFLLLSLLAAVLLSGCSETAHDYPAAIQVDGAIYVSTGEQLSGAAEPSEILGSVRSYTSQMPAKDGQSNFDRGCSAPYARTADGLAVQISGTWTLFTPLDPEA